MGNIVPDYVPRLAPDHYGNNEPVINYQRILLDDARDTKPQYFGGAAKAIWVFDASGLTATAKLYLNSQAAGFLSLKKGLFVRGMKFSDCYLTNDAQAGEYLDVLTYSGDIDIINPSADASLATITKPSVLDTSADVTAAAGAATVMIAANASRRKAWLYNPDSVVILRVGDNNVGATRGIPLLPGDRIEIDTTEAIYVYNPGASDIDVPVMWSAD